MKYIFWAGEIPWLKADDNNFNRLIIAQVNIFIIL